MYVLYDLYEILSNSFRVSLVVFSPGAPFLLHGHSLSGEVARVQKDSGDAVPGYC